MGNQSDNRFLRNYNGDLMLYITIIEEVIMFEQVSYLAVESIFPEWNNWTQFLDETTSGLRLDALAESHPIEVIYSV